MGLGDDMSETPTYLTVSDMEGRSPPRGVFPWPVLRDKDPRNRILVPRDGLREDSWWFWGSSGEVFEDLGGGVGVMDGAFRVFRKIWL